MFRSIRFKTILDLLVAALVPMGIAVFLASGRSRDELVKASEQNLQLLASVTAARVDQLIVDSARMVRIVAQGDVIREFAANADRRGALLDAVNRQLNAVPEANPDFDSCFLIGTDGIGLASTAERNVGQDLNFRDYFQAAVRGQPFASDLTIGKRSREPGIYFSSPVTAEGKVVGVLATKLKGEQVWELVNKLQVGAGGYAMLVDQYGVVISHPDGSKLYHSLAPLALSELKDFDPDVRYSVPKVESLDIPELTPTAQSRSTGGAARFTRDGETWVAGRAPMTAKPWEVIVVQPAQQFGAAVMGLARQQGRIALIVAGLAGLYAVWRARSIVRPLLSMSAAATRLASGDFTARAEVMSKDEVGRLAETFNAMVPQLEQSVELRRSVELAQRIQQSLLPRQSPAAERLEIFGRSKYCDATGGDYFDFAETIRSAEGEGKPLIAIGDVTGHGLGAALLMCTARAALRAAAQTEQSPGRLLGLVNTVLTQDAVEDLYMTMTLLIVDPDAGTVRYGCAAHDPILVFDPKTGDMRELAEGSIMLGAMPGFEYEDYHADGIPPGAVLFIGTDGIWEARNPADEMYGKDRMIEAIRGALSGSAAEIGAAVEASLEAFLQGRKIQDDVTYVVVRVLP